MTSTEQLWKEDYLNEWNWRLMAIEACREGEAYFQMLRKRALGFEEYASTREYAQLKYNPGIVDPRFIGRANLLARIHNQHIEGEGIDLDKIQRVVNLMHRLAYRK